MKTSIYTKSTVIAYFVFACMVSAMFILVQTAMAASIPTKISFTQALSTVQVGSSAQYLFALYDQDNLIMPQGATTTWSSSNPAVAVINDYGLATGLTSGITAITVMNSGLSTSTTLTVSGLPILKKIIISPTSTPLQIGTPLQFTANSLDQFNNPIGATLTWSSSNPSVGTINASNGYFNPLQAGTTIITASSGSISATSSITVYTDTTFPTTPANLIATAISSSQINLSWTAATDDIGVTGYKIYRNGASTQYATTASTSFRDSGLSASTAYSYSVRAYDAANKHSGFSNTAIATTFAATTIPATVQASSSPLRLLPGQNGKLEVAFDSGYKITLDIPSSSITVPTTISVNLIEPTSSLSPTSKNYTYIVGGKIFEIKAASDQGQIMTELANLLTITLTLNLPNDLPNLGVYYFDKNSNRWKLLADAIFNRNSSTATFKTKYLGLYSILRIPGLASTVQPGDKIICDDIGQGGRRYGDGSLLRGRNGKIYLIIQGMRRYIANLRELNQYRNRPIINVDEQTLSLHNEIMRLEDGNLVRGNNHDIYIITNQKKIKIKNLAELGKYRGKTIINVTNDIINSY